MGRFSKCLKVLPFLLVASLLWAVPITKDRFTPIYTLADDRAALVINDNFRRALNTVIEDKAFNVSIGATSTSTVINLNVAQVDTNYGIFVSWRSSMTVSNKTTENFKVTGYAPPGAGATLDWVLVR